MIIDLAFAIPLGTVFQDSKGRSMLALACPIATRKYRLV